MLDVFSHYFEVKTKYHAKEIALNIIKLEKCADVAQSVERMAFNHVVAGSSPAVGFLEH